MPPHDHSSTADRVVLALDSGSQSSRALIFDRDGRVLGQGQHAHAAMRHPVTDAVEQDPQDIRQALFQSIRDALAAWGGPVQHVVGAALTTQRSTFLPTDADGRPLGDLVSWLDRRTASIDGEPSAMWRTVLRLLGQDAVLTRLLGKSTARRWREHEPDLYARIEKVLSIESWLIHQLTGRMATSPGGLPGTWPYNAKTRTWETGDLLVHLLGFQRSWLPEIIEAGQPIGGVTEAAAAETGLPAGLPVYSCTGDKQAECLGAGVRHTVPGLASVSLGTGSAVLVPLQRPVVSRAYRWITTASAEPGGWCHEYLLFRGMWTAGWFARELGRDLEPAARARGLPVEALLAEEAAAVPAGCDGLVAWPRWAPSIGVPLETGALVGLRETHTRGHIFRALIEGIALDLRTGLALVERATSTRITELTVGGGGARSDLVVEVVCNVLDRPVRRPPSAELSARGAAIVAAVAAGLHESTEQAVAAMVPEAPVMRPDPRLSALYRTLADDVFRRVGRATLPVDRRLSRWRRLLGED